MTMSRARWGKLIRQMSAKPPRMAAAVYDRRVANGGADRHAGSASQQQGGRYGEIVGLVRRRENAQRAPCRAGSVSSNPISSRRSGGHSPSPQ